MNATLTEFITLAGTIGTFALALVAFWNIFKPLKPKIKLSHGTTGEYLSKLEGRCDAPPSLALPCKYLIYRLRIENGKKISSFSAKKVYLRFMEISRLNEIGSWEKLVPFNPVMMRWTSATDESNIFYSDLAKGEYLFANFFTIKLMLSPVNNEIINKSEIIPGYEGIKNMALAAGFPLEKLEKEGIFKFKIGVFGENMKPKEFIFEVKFCDLRTKPEPKIKIKDL